MAGKFENGQIIRLKQTPEKVGIVWNMDPRVPGGFIAVRWRMKNGDFSNHPDLVDIGHIVHVNPQMEQEIVSWGHTHTQVPLTDIMEEIFRRDAITPGSTVKHKVEQRTGKAMKHRMNFAIGQHQYWIVWSDDLTTEWISRSMLEVIGPPDLRASPNALNNPIFPSEISQFEAAQAAEIYYKDSVLSHTETRRALGMEQPFLVIPLKLDNAKAIRLLLRGGLTTINEVRKQLGVPLLTTNAGENVQDD